MHFIWRTKSFCHFPLICIHGEELVVRSPGYYNNHAGPDFLGASLEIDGKQVSGKVEIHINASDWNLHRHQYDPRYSDVILHVVYEADEEVPEGIPIFEMKKHIISTQLERMAQLGTNERKIACGQRFKTIDSVVRINWMERMTIERMQLRADEWEVRLNELNGDLVQLIHEKVARVFGFGLNGNTFEELARRLPYQIIIRYREDKEVFYELPALLAGVESESNSCWSKRTLLVRFKHGLRVMEKHAFNSGRVSPQRKHKQRIWLWTTMLLELTASWKMLLEEREVSTWLKWLNDLRKKGIPKSIFVQLVVNFFVPMQFLLGRHYEEEWRLELALALLEQMGPEDNTVIRNWNQIGIHAKNASETQGYLNLFNVYCSHKQCLNCAVGAQLLKRNEPNEILL